MIGQTVTANYFSRLLTLCESLCTLWQNIRVNVCSFVVKNGITLDNFGYVLDNFGAVWAHVGNVWDTFRHTKTPKTIISKLKTNFSLKNIKSVLIGVICGLKNNPYLAYSDQMQYAKPLMTELNKPLPLVIRDCGQMPYAEALALQLDLCAQRIADETDNTVLIVEHPPVITQGARKSENKLLASEDVIIAKGIDLLTVGRGGGTTAHNPGQLVFYPIVKLKTLKLDVNAYIRSLEQIGIELLSSLGVESQRVKGKPGLWVGEKKIASLGVQLKKWVSFHGMAINITNDLSIFDHFVPCGLEGVEITSVQKETQANIDMQKIKIKLSELLLLYFSHEHKDLTTKCTEEHGKQ